MELHDNSSKARRKSTGDFYGVLKNEAWKGESSSLSKFLHYRPGH